MKMFLRFIYFFSCYIQYFSVDIASQLLKDKNFEKEFCKMYGVTIYNGLTKQIKAWLNVKGFKNATLEDLEIICNMYIPIYEKKSFFKKLEKIILQMPNNNKANVSINNIISKQNQLMIKLYYKNKKFFSTEGIFWFLKNHHNINLSKKTLYYYEETKLLYKNLLLYLIKRKVLTKDQWNILIKLWPIYFGKNFPMEDIPYIVYGLILLNINKPKKLNNIMNNYSINEQQKKFISLIHNGSTVSLKICLHQYNQIFKNHPYKKEEIFILLILFFIKNKKNVKIQDKEWLDLFKIIVGYISTVLINLKGVGIGNVGLIMKFLLQKSINNQWVTNHNTCLIDLMEFFNKNYGLISYWMYEEISNPFFFPYMDIDGITLDNLENLTLISKKNYNNNKHNIVEFLSLLNVVLILLKDFFFAEKWAINMFVFSQNCNQFYQEKTIYFLILNYIELIISHKNHNNNEEELKQIEYKHKMDFWINKLKQVGQISIYGQYISDKFNKNYRKQTDFSLYMEKIYHNNYSKTIKNTFISKNPNIITKMITKYDWLNLLIIYTLQQENFQISWGKIITQNNKQYREIFNNKYAISLHLNYKIDYLLKLLDEKCLTSLSKLGKILIVLSLKKYRYMSMLGKMVENRTGTLNCFSIHPMDNFLEKYKNKDTFDLGLLSALINQETQFTMIVDKGIYGFFDFHTGSGLFQINFQNAKNAAKTIGVNFNTERLHKDIQYNFMIIIEFLKKMTNWLKSKHIINWIISYNASQKVLKKWHNNLIFYKLNYCNEESQELYTPFVLNLIPSHINRHYVTHVLSFWGNNNYYLDNNYINLLIKNKSSWI